MSRFYVIHLAAPDQRGRERYFTAAGRLWGWTWSIDQALQFAREADAVAIARAFCPTSWTVVPHDRHEQWPTVPPSEFQEFEYDG